MHNIMEGVPTSQGKANQSHEAKTDLHKLCKGSLISNESVRSESWDTVFQITQQWATEMVQTVKVFGAKPDDLNLISRTHILEGEN